MTVAELIAELQKANGDDEVLINYHYKSTTFNKVVDHIATKAIDGYVFIHCDALTPIQKDTLTQIRKQQEDENE